MRCNETLSDEVIPDAKKIIIVSDNLSTHNPSSFFSVMSPRQPTSLATGSSSTIPLSIHASGLNIAECELSVMSKQSLE
ncbi:MAG: hypothetical protein FWG10_04920 [Eubacteriaceae bacterium]|nr:hypothetical protein [Eubacteriaceae bacterium]